MDVLAHIRRPASAPRGRGPVALSACMTIRRRVPFGNAPLTAPRVAILVRAPFLAR